MYGIYEVLEGHTYRHRQAGEQFEARLDRPAEPRAVKRGVIKLIDTTTPTIAGCSYTFPEGWLAQPMPTEAPRGAFFMDRKE